MSNKDGVLFVISAPTGGGKTTLVLEAIKRLGPYISINKVITYTTRPPRSNEIHENDYFFISKEDFLQKKHHQFFLETTEYDGYWYGSPASIVHDLKIGRSYIIVTDTPGAKIIKTLLPESILIWISVPSIDSITERLQKRGSEMGESFARRINIAKQEIENEIKTPIFNYHIMNNNFNDALEALIQIIRQEAHRRNESLE